MPDPLTALGAAAAASQFIAQGLKITIYFYQAFQKIKDAPENIRKALAEVEQLISISKLIIQNESLQTESIASTLGICLRDITKLESILRKVSPGEDASKSEKFRKAVVATFKEDAITKLLASLDREKMNLSLCMHEINSSLLGSIGIQLQGAQTTAGELLLVVNDSARNIQTVVDVLPGIAEQVTTIHDSFPDISDRLSKISVDLLPAIISLIQAKHEEMMSVLVGSPKTGGHFNVPNRLSRHFVGRDDILQRLHQLCRQDCQSSTTIVLRALGGQGKSQVAMKFCQETRGSTFVSTFWIDASSELSINKSMHNFYLQTRPSSSEKLDSAEAIAEYVRDHFERMVERWLIVFDNLDEPGDVPVVRDLIPASKLGMVLVTSRHADALVLADSGCTIELEALHDMSASELLVRAANLDPTSPSCEQALIISKKLSNHPLAIAQAGSYIRRRKLPLSEFIHQYERHLQLVLTQNHLPLSEYQRKLNDEEKATSLSVFATWELSLAQLQQEKIGPKIVKEDLLNLLGFSYSIEVPEDIFAVFCANIQPWDSAEIMRKAPGAYLAEQLGNWNSATYVEVLAEFLDLSLIQGYNRREDGFYQAFIHPLVKDWIMLRVPEDRSAEYRILMMEILTEAMDQIDGNPDLLPPALDLDGLTTETELNQVLANHETLRGSPGYGIEYLKRLLRAQNSLLKTMFECGRMHQVERMGRHLIPLNDKLFGAVSMESVTLGANIAEALCQLDKYPQAERLARRLLPQSMALDGIESAKYRYILKILARALNGGEQYEESLAIIDKSLALEASLLGSHSNSVLDGMLDLAQMFDSQRKHADAIAKCLEVKAALTTLADSNDMDDSTNTEKTRAKCSYSLGCAYYNAERWSESVEEIELALQYNLTSRGETHLETIFCFLYLGLSLAKLGKLEESEYYHCKTDELLSAILGPVNSRTLFNAWGLAWCLWKQGKLLQAEKHYRRAYEGYLILRGGGSGTTEYLVRCLALVLRDRGLEDEGGHLIRHHYKQLLNEQVLTEEEIDGIIQETLCQCVDDF